MARRTVPWKGLLNAGGIDALRAVPGRGRPARLDARQLGVGMLIKRMYGVEFGQAQILVHQIAHLHEPHHTPAFWLRVERVMPDYAQRKVWLAEHGIDVEGI